VIALLHFYQQQVQRQSTAAQFFDKIPFLTFKAEPQTCPVDGQRLQVWKTSTRTIKALGIGTFKARHISLYCKKHRDLGPRHSQELAELVPAHNNVAYNVMVEIGKLRFRENRQVREIKQSLLDHHAIDLCSKEIELLIDKFVFYLAAVHQESAELINAQIQAQGGYILHVDSTCEGDSPKLASSLDPVSGFVLYSLKLNTENKDEVANFLKEIKSRFGTPHAIVSDMSKGIEAAVREVFGTIAHYVCHFHFLTVIGLLLLEKEHLALRQALAKAGVSGKLKAWTRTLVKSFETLTIDEIDDYLTAPEKLSKTREATEMLAYGLMLWILDHASEGHGYGFPFDHRYLNFYERLQAAHALIAAVKPYYPVNTANDAILWKLDQVIENIVSERRLHQTVAQYKIKLAVFSNLRRAMGAAPEPTNNGLRQLTVTTSQQELQKIKSAVEAFRRALDKQIQKTTAQPLRDNLIKVKERITEYGDRLFADPIVVDVKGEKRCFFIHRTNNIMEQHFRQFNYSYRRIHGNRSVRRNLENIPEQTPLVENFRNPNYVKLIFVDDTKIAKRFSEIEVTTIRKMAAEHRSKKKSLRSAKTKRLLRRPDFKKQLVAAFAVAAG
jgi:hypothetical protein